MSPDEILKGAITSVLRTLGLGLFIASAVYAAPVKIQDPLTSPGWQHFYNNEYDEAISEFAGEVAKQPKNAAAYNHLAQAVLYRELFRNGALESQLVTGNNPFLRRAKLNVAPEIRERFETATLTAVNISKSRLSQDPKDPEALYNASVAYGLRANYHFLVEKAWSDALHDATASRKFSDRLIKVDPGLTDAYLVQGVHDYVVGSLPFYVKMVGFLAGFHGDRQTGIRELQDVARRGVLNKYDAQILLAVIYRREHCPENAIPLLKDVSEKFPRNYLLRLEQVQMYSDAGDKSSALDVLRDVERLRAAGAKGYRDIPAEKVRYLRGNLLFWYGDFGPAIKDMQAATAKVEDLDLNTAVLAWLRLGQLYDLQGDHERAIHAYKETMRAAPDSSAASEARSYISSPYHRKSADG